METFATMNTRNTLVAMRKNLMTGILVIGPVVVTIFLLWKSFLFIDGILSEVVNVLLALIINSAWLKSHPLPGVGFITLLILLTIIGFAARNVGGQWLITRLQRGINQIPLVNRIYKAIQQISNALLSGRQEIFKNAVLIEYPRLGVYSIGITTSEAAHHVQDVVADTLVSVFIPTTPNPTSGFLLFVPKKDVIVLKMSVESALKLIISAGTVSNPDEDNTFSAK